LLTLPVLADDLPSALGEIRKRSQELLERGRATQFADKGRDSGEVASLVEHFQDAVTHYQVSKNHSVGLGVTHTGIDITTASDLCQNHWLQCEYFPVCFSLSCADDRSHHRVVLQYSLKTSGGDAVQQGCHDIH